MMKSIIHKEILLFIITLLPMFRHKGEIFYCDTCDYNTPRKGNLTAHIKENRCLFLYKTSTYLFSFQ